MLTDTLDALRPQFQSRRPHGDFLRVSTAFEDVTALAQLHSIYEAAAMFKPSENSPDDLRLICAAGRTADALHRSLVEAACRALTVLLHEVFGRPGREINTTRLVEKPDAAILVERVAWSQLYCLTVFRNKIVTHHDVPRMGGSITDPDGTRRLSPLPRDFHIADADAIALYEMRDRTGFAASEENHFLLLDTLFYAIPVTFGAPQSADRRHVNKIAERGGVRSLSVQEITNGLRTVLADVPSLLALASG